MKLAKIRLESDIEIESFLLENLSGKTQVVKNNTNIFLDNNWYLLRFPYNGQKIEISEIYINDCPLLHLKYTGYFENSQGQKFQPATAVWGPGEFKIWIHTNIGYMKGEILTQIFNGDYGKNLFNDYLLTVDRPMQLPDDFPVDLQEFFGHGTGPKWWHKNKQPLPYKELDVDFTEMFNQIELIEMQCQIDMKERASSKLWTHKSWDGQSVHTATAKDFDAHSFNGFGKYFQQMGYKQIYQLYIASLGPRGFIDMHIDDHKTSKNYDNIKGNTKFYCSYANADQVFFKMAGVGCIPIEKPLMVDAGSFPHAVVNLSDTQTRKTLNLTGVLN